MFTARAVTVRHPGHDHVHVFLHRTRASLARAVTVATLAAGLLTPAASAQAATPAPTPTPTTKAGDGTANSGAADGRITFGMTTASAGTTDARGMIAVNAPPGSVVYDNVAVVNLSDALLNVDLYTADVTNGTDGALDVAARTDKKQLAGGWVALGQSAVSLAAQSTKAGPGFKVVPITITIPKDAEPGDHLAAVLASVTAQGKPGENTPAINLEHRVGVRVYVTVQGDIRPGLTIEHVKTHFFAGGAFGSGTMEVEYTLTNSGNVRYGVKPTVRAAGPFALAPHTADGTTIDELLPHSSVTQKVTLNGVFPLLLENVVVSAAATAAQGGSDPGIGTVHASSWTWLWTWLLLILVLLVALAATWWQVRRRRSRPGVWGPPEGLWGGTTKPADGPAGGSAPPIGDEPNGGPPPTGDEPNAADEPAAGEPVGTGEPATVQPAPEPTATDGPLDAQPVLDARPGHDPEPEPVR